MEESQQVAQHELRRSNSFRRLIGKSLNSIGWLIVLGIAATYLARWIWLSELLCSYRLHLVSGGLIVAIAAGLMRRWYLMTALAIAALPTMILFASFFAGQTATSGDANQHAANQELLRVVSFNVLTSNRDFESTIEFLQEANADAIVLYEVDQGWIDAVCEALPDYEYRLAEARRDNFGMIILSRLPLERQAVHPLRSGLPVLETILVHNETRWHLWGVHVLPPIEQATWRSRNQDIAEVAKMINERISDEPLIVVGDFNLTPWSPIYNDFLSANSLVDARRGFGCQRTWPTDNWLTGIPIDHAFVSPSVNVIDWDRGPEVGSDHFPIIVDLKLK